MGVSVYRPSPSVGDERKWLPEASRTDRQSNPLISWEVTAPLPEPNGRGPHRNAPPEAALQRRRDRRMVRGAERSGQPRIETGSGSAATGPVASGPGQATGPTVDDDPDPWAEALGRLRGHLARAREHRAWIDAEPGRLAADVARRDGLTRARVCQLASLLKLAPAILADLDATDRRGPVPTEDQLRAISRIADPAEQWARYAALVPGGRAARPTAPKRQPPPARSFQQDFERARRYRALWNSGEVVSLAEIGRREGIGGERVGQILNLLHLAPEIIAVLDVPPEGCPAEVGKREMRRIGQMRDHGEQIAEFRRLWPGVLAGKAA